MVFQRRLMKGPNKPQSLVKTPEKKHSAAVKIVRSLPLTKSTPFSTLMQRQRKRNPANQKCYFKAGRRCPATLHPIWHFSRCSSIFQIFLQLDFVTFLKVFQMLQHVLHSRYLDIQHLFRFCNICLDFLAFSRFFFIIFKDFVSFFKIL